MNLHVLARVDTRPLPVDFLSKADNLKDSGQLPDVPRFCTTSISPSEATPAFSTG
jgi:hypothetical protein